MKEDTSILQPTLETFTCCDCGVCYARGMDVEKDVYLSSAMPVDTRCVFCYNKAHPKYPINVLHCQQQASYFVRHGSKFFYTFLETEKGISILD